jgi:lysophospholipase L1-like esterase
MRKSAIACLVILAACWPATLGADGYAWITSWTASVQGPYPSGNATAQPDLSLVFPSPAIGARDQSFRLIVRPDIWGPETRIRLSNAFGTKPVTFDGVHVGLQLSGSAVLPGTNHAVLFQGKPSVTSAPGESAWSDAFAVASSGQMAGRKMAVSFHVAGESGPMTWHAKALTTSYVSKPDAGAKGKEEGEASFPLPTSSRAFLDALDMMAPAATRAIVAFGDSITDGTASTLNGDDRWPDVLSRRVHAAFGNRFSVVNAGIGGNQVAGPAAYSAEKPSSGGPSAIQRLDRDVLGLSGVGSVVWLEGINDFNRTNHAAVDVVEAGMKEVVGRLRAKIPDVRVIGATVTSSVGSASGTPEQEIRRKSLNEFIRTGGLFDAVADFDQATVDPQTGGLRAEFVPESTTGGAGDKLHPNRLGYAAMGMSIDLDSLLPKAVKK